MTPLLSYIVPLDEREEAEENADSERASLVSSDSASSSRRRHGVRKDSSGGVGLLRQIFGRSTSNAGQRAAYEPIAGGDD
jgi:hypothetical protein